MQLEYVDPKSVVVPEIRVTAQFDDDLYEQFKASMQAVGQITPPVTYQVNGDLVLCDGLHRLQEAIANGEKEIGVVVIPGDMVDVLTKNIFLDHLRGKTQPTEMVRVIGALYTEYGLDVDQIREKTGLTRAYIERLIAVSKCSSSVLDALDKGVLGVSHAYEISRLPYEIQQEEVVAKHAVWRWTVPELKDQIDAVLREMQNMKEAPPPAAPTEPREPRKYTCEGCQSETEARYLRPVMVCPDCFGHVWRIGKARKADEVADEVPS